MNNVSDVVTIVPPAPRGFAAMDPAKVREISSKGGKAAHLKGTAHKWNSEEAKAYGRKGGLAKRNRIVADAE